MSLLALLPASLLSACPVCFGASDQPDLGSAFRWGIVLLLAATGLMLAGIIAAVRRIEKARSLG